VSCRVSRSNPIVPRRRGVGVVLDNGFSDVLPRLLPQGMKDD